MTDPIDFSQCECLPSRAYNGANGKKITACYEALFVQQKVGDHTSVQRYRRSMP